MNHPGEPDRFGDETLGAAVPRPPALWPSLPPEELAEYELFYRTAAPQLAAFLIVTQRASKREAAECAHEALVQYLHHRSSVRIPMAWCRRASRSTFLKRRFDAEESFEEVPATGSPLYPADPTDEDQRAAAVTLVEQLPPRQRETVTLAFDGYSSREIAAELGIAEDVVRSNLRHARVRMKELYDQDATGTEEDR